MNESDAFVRPQMEGMPCGEESEPLRHVQQLISGLSNKQRAINTCDIETAIETLKVLRKSDKLNGDTVKVIDNQVVDLLIAVIASTPAQFDDHVSDIFISYWSTFGSKVEKLLMPRKVHILATQSNGSQSWNKYEQILVKLYAKNFLTAQTIEREVFASLKEEWDDNVLHKIASVLQSLADCSKRRNGRELELMEIVDWLAWFCCRTNEF